MPASANAFARLAPTPFTFETASSRLVLTSKILFLLNLKSLDCENMRVAKHYYHVILNTTKDLAAQADFL